MTTSKIVTIDTGRIKGTREKDYHEGIFYRFSGIPYAKAPVGPLRFRPPQPIEPWEEIRDGSKEGPSCPHIMMFINRFCGKEDNCLNLSVYTKELPTPERNNLRKPVMVFLHGGGFIFGSNLKKMNGPKYLLTQDIVLVIPNYRLGILGFLSLADQNLGIPGNNGLKDQVMALQWVQRNIHHFGGDPLNVTLFGECAGAASAHYMTFSPASRGLFHKVIMQSGSAFNGWARGKSSNSEEVKSLLKYHPQMNESYLLDKLKVIDCKILARVVYDSDTSFANTIRPFGPVIEYPHEGAFLCEDPEEIIKSCRAHQIPMIIGFNSNEGVIYEMFRKIKPAQNAIPKTLEKDIPYCLNLPVGSERANEFIRELQEEYFPDGDISKRSIYNRCSMMGDNLYLQGIAKTVNLHKENTLFPIYAYRFNVESQLNFITQFCQTKHHFALPLMEVLIAYCRISRLRRRFRIMRDNLLIRPLTGVSHGDELQYIFSNSLSPKIIVNSEEDRLIKRQVKLWTNFARDNHPTPENDELFNNSRWCPVRNANIDIVMEINNKELNHILNPNKERIMFWDALYEKYMEG